MHVLKREFMYVSAGSGTHKFVCQKWRDQIFPMINFVVFPRWSLWFGGLLVCTFPLCPRGVLRRDPLVGPLGAAAACLLSVYPMVSP